LEQAKNLKDQAYVLTSAQGKPVTDSGVRIGPLDLSFETQQTLKQYRLPDDLVAKMQPYLGKRGQAAEQALSQNPLQVTDQQYNQIVQSVVQFWKPRFDKAPVALKQNPKVQQLAQMAKNNQWAEFLYQISQFRQQLQGTPKA
jgi:hypothetical protein